MIRTEDIYELIKSLTPSEKRYFKLFSSFAKKNEENNYVTLFDVIDKLPSLENINENLQKKLKKTSFDSNLQATRTYLHTLILKSLKSYNNSSASDKIEDMLKDVRILYSKGLYTQTNEILDKLEEITLQEEKYHHLLEAYVYRNKMTPYSVDESGKSNMERSNSIYEKYKTTLAILDQQTEYNILFNRINELYLDNKLVRSEEINKQLTTILQHPLLQSKDLPASFEAKKIFHAIHIIGASFIGNAIKENEFCHDLLMVFENNPEKTKTNFAFYTSTIRNYINSSLHLLKTENLDAWINKYQNLPQRYPGSITPEKGRIMQLMASDFMLNLYIANNQFSEADIYVKNNLDKIISLLDTKKYKVNTNSRMWGTEVSYNIAYIAFANGQYKESLKWINKIENESHKENLIQIQTYAKLLRLILLFELNDPYLNYTLRSTYRFLLRQNRLLKFEKTIIDCLKFIPKFNTTEEFHKFYETININLLPLWENELEKRNLRSLNLLAWAKSKLSKKSFTEALVSISK